VRGGRSGGNISSEGKDDDGGDGDEDNDGKAETWTWFHNFLVLACVIGLCYWK
jgi:hypothetical protein